jgi:hypothetical protein
VPDHDFFFALDMSDEPDLDRMAGELATAVLGHVGYPAAATNELSRALHAALTARLSSGERRCTVRFVAGGGQLQVAIAGDGAPEWRTSRPLPAS